MVGLERTIERLHAGEQVLLQVDEDEVAASLALGRVHERGVSGELLRDDELFRARVPDLDLHERALRELLDAELPEVLFEPADHHRLELRVTAHGDAAREALRIEQLEERRETVRVPVVRRRAEEQATLGARDDVSYDARDLRVDGVSARARGRGDVGFVQDEEALLLPLSDVLEQRVAVLGRRRMGCEMMKRVCVLHGFTPNPRSCRRRPRKARFMTSNWSPNFFCISSRH